MKITLKTLKGQQLPLDVDPTINVSDFLAGASGPRYFSASTFLTNFVSFGVQIADLKAKIAETHGMAAETQKLIAYGKVMDDETKTVTDYKVGENGFIVVMTVKVSPIPLILLGLHFQILPVRARLSSGKVQMGELAD